MTKGDYWWEDDYWWIEPALTPNLTVYEEDPEPSGLLGPDGRPFVKKPPKIGFELNVCQTNQRLYNPGQGGAALGRTSKRSRTTKLPATKTVRRNC